MLRELGVAPLGGSKVGIKKETGVGVDEKGGKGKDEGGGGLLARVLRAFSGIDCRKK